MNRNSQLENRSEVNIECVISIVTYNALEKVKETLKSLEWVKKHPEIQIIILDNNSIEPVFEFLQTEQDWITLLESESNSGFGAGHNKIYKYATSVNPNFILLLNPDCNLSENSYNNLLEFLKKPENSQVGVIGPRILDSQGNIEPTILKDQNLWNSGISLGLQLLGIKHKPIAVPLSGIHEVKRISGACLLIRTRMIEDTGLFDPDFFMYYEDHDFCNRVVKKGWKIFINCDVTAKHYIGASSADTDLNNDWKNEMMFKSLLIYFDKNKNWFEQRLLKLGWIFGLCLRYLLGRRKESSKKLLNFILNYKFH